MRNKSSISLFILLFAGMAMAFSGCETAIHYPEGGYDYPKHVEDTNYYFYPLKSLFSERDSFRAAYNYIYYQAFNEPNLSLKPAGEDIFRLSYEGFKDSPMIIILTKGKIVAKRGTFEEIDKEDTNRLSQIENFHYRILHHSFPLQNRNYGGNYQLKKNRDSLIKLYPQLLDPAYFKYLIKKITVPNTHYKYTFIERSIPYSEYYRLVLLINETGYWKMPFSLPCEQESTDGFGFSLEANTAKKYNFVGYGSCGNIDSMQKKFSAACQQIIKCAGLNNSIHVAWDSTAVSKPVHDNIILQDFSLAYVKEDSVPSIKHTKTKHKK